MKKAEEFASKHEYETAIRTLNDALVEIRPSSLKATVLLRMADVRQVPRQLTDALKDLRTAELLLDDIDPIKQKREHSTLLRCYLFSLRSKYYVEWGLLDIAYVWAMRAKALLPEPVNSGETSTTKEKADQFDRVRILANSVEATVLVIMEDYVSLEAAVTAALTDGVYTRFPGEKAKLLALLGLALKESARLNPLDAARSRSFIESALQDPDLPGLDRISPELALGELAIRKSEWAEAEKWITSAAGHLGSLGEHSALPAYAAWSALSARLLFERQDHKAQKEDLEAMRQILDQVLSERIKEWGDRELRAGGYGFLQYADKRSLISELMRLDLALEMENEGATRAVTHLLAAESMGTLARRIGAHRADLTEVQTQLLGNREDHALLIYFPAPDRTHLFVVDHASVRHFPLPAADYIQAARFEAEKVLRRPVQRSTPQNEVRKPQEALSNLAALLFPPEVQATLKTRSRWTIVGRDLLGEVPFEALPLDHGEYAGLAKAITHLPSLAVGLQLAERARHERRTTARKGDNSVVLLAAPDRSDLAVSTADLQAMIAAYPSKGRHLWSGTEASLDRLRKGMESASVTQLFTHGRFDEDRERAAVFLLASAQGSEPGFMGADEIESLNASPLVILTVCGAGRGYKRRGDASAADLAGAFLMAGTRCRCVVQSSYDLDVEAARQLSVHFHAALSKGDDPAEALRKARVQLAKDPLFADPFYHGLISIVGLGHEPIFSR